MTSSRPETKFHIAYFIRKFFSRRPSGSRPMLHSHISIITSTMTENFLFKSILTGISLILSSQLSAIAQNVQPRQDAKKGTWGYSNAEGKWVLKPKFETASPFEKQPGDRLLSTVSAKGLIGFVDENGKLVGPEQSSNRPNRSAMKSCSSKSRTNTDS